MGPEACSFPTTGLAITTSSDFFGGDYAIKITRLERMVSRIHRIVIRSEHTVRTSAAAVSIEAVRARIKIAFDDKMKPYFG